MWTRTHARRTRLVALLIAALAGGLLVASPAQAAAGIQKAPSAFDSTSSDSRITFTWRRPVARVVQSVKYTVTIAGNRNMRKDSNYQVKTVYGKTRSSTSSTARDNAVFSIKAPTSYGYGAKVWVKVVTKAGKYTKADPQKASNRYSAGLKPANPSAGALKVTETCKGFTARWASAPTRSRGVKVQVAGGINKTYVGYEPSRSVTVSSLKAGTAYRVRAQATSVGERSAWTDWQSITTKACASRVVRVGSYNLLVATAKGVQSWTARAPKAASQIVASDNDVVGLQEAPSFSYKQVQKLQSELKERGKPFARADTSYGGVHLIYRNDRFTKVGSTEYFYLSATDERKRNALGVAQAFRAKTGNNPPFIVVSLHSTKGKQAEVARALSLAVRVKRANNIPDAAVVFTGDVVLASTEEKRTAVRAELSKTLSDAEFFQPGRRLDSYNSRNALIKCPPHVSGIKVDGIFASDSAAVTYWNMPKYKFSKGCFRDKFPSDHNLLTANVWLPAL